MRMIRPVTAALAGALISFPAAPLAFADAPAVSWEGDAESFASVSGELFDAWLVLPGDDLEGTGAEAAIDAARRSPVEFTMISKRVQEAYIENLPGDIASYGEGGGWGPAHRVSYWYSPSATRIEDLPDDATLIAIDPEASGFTSELSVTLMVPNIKNELLLIKTDEDTGEPVPGARFGLYVDKGQDGVPDSPDDPVSTMVTNMDGTMKVNSRWDLLEAGSYVLIENGKPATHSVNPTHIRIVVDGTGVHVDAGWIGDGVRVETRMGGLVASMKGFAAGDDVDGTLHDVVATTQLADAFEGARTDWRTSDEAPSHLSYMGLIDGTLAYGLTAGVVGNGDGVLSVDEGWSRLHITQCLAHDGASGSPKRNLSDPDAEGYIEVSGLDALFSGDVTILMTDKAEEPTGPALSDEALVVNTFILAEP